MRSALLAKMALGSVAIVTGGSLAGVGLANYVASGSFEFYKQPRVAEWQPESGATAIGHEDLAWMVPSRAEAGRGAPGAAPQFAAYDR